MAKGKKERGMPLRHSLVLLFLACWVLPVILLIGVVGLFSRQASAQRVTEVITTTVENTMEGLCHDLDSAVSQSIGVSYVPTIRLAYAQYERDGNYTTLYNTAEQFLRNHYDRSQEVLGAYLVFSEDTRGQPDLCYAYNPRLYQSTQVLAFYANGARQQALDMMETLDTDIGFFVVGEHLYMARNLSLRDNRFDPYAVLVNEIPTQHLYGSLHNLPWQAEVRLSLDGIDLPIPRQEESAIEPLARNRQPQSGELVLDNSAVRDRYTLAYTVAVDMRPLLAETNNTLLLIAVIALVSVPLMAPVLFFLMRWINRPIQSLSRLARRIERGELGAQTDLAGFKSREFRYLGTQMNAMSARLEEQFERLYREELALRDARIKALQSQINPHFLGNTLEIINWKARLACNEKVSGMLEALSTILRAGLDRGQRPLVPLSEEMIYIDAYLYIIHQRLGQRLTIEMEIEDELLDWHVPRLILQPIVENAVEHGVENQPTGAITIRARRLDEAWMSLEVVNDAPLSAEDEAAIRRLLEEGRPDMSSGNIGIRNVHLRLRILYGGQSGLVVQNDGNGNTVSSMRIHNKPKPQGS